MKRTANRPLPAGHISLKAAVTAGTLFAAGGLLLLLLTGSLTAAGTGLFTLVWYNLVYTPLKKVTPFAVLPGALIGALPPMIGWAAAGGSLINSEILLISFFLFIGQMPHYWLLMMKVGDEFRDAGLPVITEKFSTLQLRNISFTWILAAAVAAAFFPASGIMHHAPFGFLLLGGVVIFLLRMGLLSFRGRIMLQWNRAFITVNLFYLFIILVLLGDEFAESYLYF
jgi:heme o synthase